MTFKAKWGIINLEINNQSLPFGGKDSVILESLLILCSNQKDFQKFFAKFRKFMEGYCVRCRAKRDMKDVQEVAMKGRGGVKRRAAKGVCSKCDTKMYKILPKA